MIKKFQDGGSFLDEAELFSDEPVSTGEGTEGVDSQSIGSDYKGEGGPEGDTEGDPKGQASEGVAAEGVDNIPNGAAYEGGEDLSGIDLFLSDYGVRGGIIKFEDGQTARFDELTPDGQKEVLSSLVQTAVPSIEDKYALNDSEITFLNALRESGADTVEDFVNNIVDHRMDSVIDENAAVTMNFKEIPVDDIYLMHLRETNENLTDADLIDELEKAQQLSTYDSIVEGIRNGYETKQNELISSIKEGRDNVYMNELEGQRHEIASLVADMDNVAGSPLTDDVKEHLLHDMMELNEHNDPLLMEKIFSDPETMFKTNWFLTYGEDYIKNLNDYWKKEVSKATKSAYENSINGMPQNPTIIGADRGNKRNMSNPEGGAIQFGTEVDEQELFDND